MASVLGEPLPPGLEVDYYNRTYPPSVTPPLEVMVNYGWVVPVSIIGFSVVVVGFCLTFFAVFGRHKRRYQVDSFTQPKETFDEWATASIKSVTPVKQLSTQPAYRGGPSAHYRPRLGKINESPEDRLAEWRARHENPDDALSPDDSILSILAQTRFELSAMTGVQIPYITSPNYYPSSSISHPNLIVSAQAPFSPYRFTWVSPTSLDPRVVRSDPNIKESSFPSHMYQGQMLNNTASDRNSYQSVHVNQSSSWIKSPYHPNFNTPMGSDADSNNVSLPNNIIINRPQSCGNTPPANPSPASAGPGAGPGGPGAGPGGHGAGPAEPGAPTGPGGTPLNDPRFRLAPPVNPSGGGEAIKKPRADSPAPCHMPKKQIIVRNNSDIVIMPLGHVTHFPYDLRQLAPQVYARIAGSDGHVHMAENLAPCDQCQMCPVYGNHSMFPNIGSSNTSMCNLGHGQYSANGCFYNTSSSMCAHIDSYESTQTSGSLGAPGSQQSMSGCQAGPSHSTSLTGQSSYQQSRGSSLSSRDQSIGTQKSDPNVSSVRGDSARVVFEDSSTSCGGRESSATVTNQPRGLRVGSTDSSIATSSDFSQNSTNYINHLSTTAHSTRSAPAAMGGPNLRTESQSDEDHSRSTGLGQSQPSVADSQRPDTDDSDASSKLLSNDERSKTMTPTSTSAPLTAFTPETANYQEYAVDVPRSTTPNHCTPGTGVHNPGYEWDAYSYTSRNIPASRHTTPDSYTGRNIPASRHTTPESIQSAQSIQEYGPHLHLLYTAQPILSDKQYWL